MLLSICNVLHVLVAALWLAVTQSVSCTTVSLSSECSQPLGLQDGRIPDSQLTASSSYQPSLVGPANARLNTERGGGAWCPKSLIDNTAQETEEYLEIDLVQDHVISAVLLQGRFANGLGQEFAEYVSIAFKQQSQEKFDKYTDPAGSTVIPANVNTFQVVQYNLSRVVVASKVRIIPWSSHPRTVCMRVELKGCLYPGRFFTLLTKERTYEDLDNLYLQSRSGGAHLDWNESIYLAIAVGILVTVIFAASAAVGFVLYRSRMQEEKPSISRYNFIGPTDSDASLQTQPPLNQLPPQALNPSLLSVTSLASSLFGDPSPNRQIFHPTPSKATASNSDSATIGEPIPSAVTTTALHVSRGVRRPPLSLSSVASQSQPNSLPLLVHSSGNVAGIGRPHHSLHSRGPTPGTAREVSVYSRRPNFRYRGGGEGTKLSPAQSCTGSDTPSSPSSPGLVGVEPDTPSLSVPPTSTLNPLYSEDVMCYLPGRRRRTRRNSSHSSRSISNGP